MRVRTQEEVCKAYGKKENNRKFVSSMIMKGEVVKVNWGYEFEIWDKSNLKELKEENERLKERVHELEEVCKDSLFGDKDDDLNTATVQRHYYEDLYNQEVADKEKRIEKAFRWIKMIKPTAKKEEFYEWIMSDEE